MLVIDDSKLKLLKMKEKMLDLAIADDGKTLAEYQRLSIEIDHECYQMIIDKIRSNNGSNLPFEEQIKYYNEISEDYDYLNELQCRFRSVYAKYSSDELILSDLSNIMIDDVRTKVSQIEGYLINVKNLKSNKMELDRLNQALVQAVNNQKRVKDLMTEIRRKLKNDVLNAKGRIQGQDGSLEITSINLELKHYGLDLNSIVDDTALLDEVYGEAKHDKEEASETLNVALDLPNRDDTICSMYMQALLEANYRFNLLELVKETFTETNDYALFKDSLYKIEDLVKEIKNGLRELGIKFYINPFDYIKIKDYVAMFENVKDPAKEIADTKKTITYLANMIDDMEKANNAFLLSINDAVTILKQTESEVTDTNTLYLDIDEFTPDADDKKITEILRPANAKDNQVVGVNDTNEEFKQARVKEKTREVINRVYKMLLPKEQTTTTPELIIEKKEVKPVQEVATTPTEESMPELDLFQEVEPFEKPVFFDDRSDSGVFDDKDSKKMEIDLTQEVKETPLMSPMVTNEAPLEQAELTMPELFWVPKEEIEEKHLRR